MPPSSRSPRAQSRQLPDLSALTILVVEDDPDGREFLKTILERCGAAVMAADDVRTAREYVETVPIQLIVTDLALPHEDGASFLGWLRARPGNKGGAIAVVAVTAYHERYPPTTLNGFAAYFQKPLDIDDFLRTIADLLGRRALSA
jgi:CheY-like chemotaxis protein